MSPIQGPDSFKSSYTPAARTAAQAPAQAPSPTAGPQPAAAAPRDQVALSPTTWTKDRPLSEAKNAHKTNTVEDFEAALKDGSNWLEGDVRTEINPPKALEMRHDKGQESGDNLTLEQWLTKGKASGRGLKLDVKEGERMDEILAMCEKIGVPSERLMFNLGDGDMAKWGGEIRRRFPDAQVAINPADDLGGKHNEGPLEDWQVDRMLALAEQTGDPTTFVVRYDRLTDDAIRRLEARGTVSVWNAPSQAGVDDVAGLTRQLRLRGVTGVVDLRESMGLVDKAEAAGDWVVNQGKGLLDKIF